MQSRIDFNVLRKFNQQGPRYTSYPTAPLFSPDFTSGDLVNEIAEMNKSPDGQGVSLYFHFPFCEKLCYFCGCNMMVTRDRSLIRRYNDYLRKEVDLLRPLIREETKVTQMHWGGGTPSYLEPGEIREMGRFIGDRFAFDPKIEASVEIDPRGLTRAHMEAFREVGFNRTSFGVQDFNPEVQEAINRVQSEEITRQTVDWARELGFYSINLDLIYGLPYQTIESFEKTVDKVIDISPDRLAIFNYAHVPWLKKHQAIMPVDAMPNAEARLEILQMTIEKLMAAGYVYIGMDHFAKPTDELAVAQQTNTLYRNFQGYSTRAGCDVYAFGVSAISQFRNVYAQNAKNLADYYASLDRGEVPTRVGYRMTADDHVRKETIMQLMCNLAIDKSRVDARFGIDFDDYFRAEIRKLKVFLDNGLLEIDRDSIRVVNSGILVIRNIAMHFDAHLEKMMKETPVFSKTV